MVFRNRCTICVFIGTTPALGKRLLPFAAWPSENGGPRKTAATLCGYPLRPENGCYPLRLRLPFAAVLRQMTRRDWTSTLVPWRQVVFAVRMTLASVALAEKDRSAFS